jgi:hypothetical protein
MSLFDDASLAMIPSAYKDGKLYSIKPTDGSGDFTFTRGSNLAATRVDENGLIKKGRENLVLQSNQFDTTWALGGATITSGQADKDGGTDAWALTSTTTNGAHRVLQTFTGAANNVVTFSVFAKANGYNFLRIVENSATGDFATFDLSDGSVENNTAISNTAKIEAVSGADGWYRCSVAVDCGATTRFDIYTMATSGVSEFLGDGVSGAYIMNAQVEQGLVATDYIETTTTTAQAGILEDMPRLDYSGGASCPSLLLEPQRTNVVINSEYVAGYSSASTTITQNYGISPEGVQNSARVQFSGTGYIVFSVTTYTNEVTSMYVKGAAGEEIRFGKGANVAQGALYTLTGDWQRIVYDVGSPSSNFIISNLGGATTNDFEVYGLQHEEGSYPTSYIPTYGTSQTRSDDFMNISSLADEIDGNSFTYFLEINNEAVVRDSATGNISVGASGNRFFLYNDSSATARMKLYIQDVTTQSYQLSADNVKLVVRIEPNKVEVFENGVSVLSTTQNLDFSGNSSYVLRGATREMGIKQTAIFPTPLTDSECIALTTI